MHTHIVPPVDHLLDYNNSTYNPCKALLNAILQKAIMDLFRLSLHFVLKSEEFKMSEKKERQELLDYFFVSKIYEYGSFDFICDELMFKKNEIRDFLRSSLEEISRGIEVDITRRRVNK